MNRVWALLFLAALTALSGCASGSKSSNSETVERIPVTYDSTKSKAPLGSSDLPAKDGECKHAWVAGKPHMFTDASYGLPMQSLCTPVYCMKCGLERHECEKLSRRKR